MITRTLLSLALLSAALAIVAQSSGLDALIQSARKLSPATVTCVALFLCAGCLLAALRLQLAARDLGYRLSFREALAAMSIGQLAGSMFFQIAGQLIGRSWFLSRRNMPVAATIVLTGYERLAALAVSLVFAAAGAFFIFGKITVKLDAGGADFLRLLAGLGFAIVAGAVFAWGRKVIGNVSLGPQAVLAVMRSIALSAAVQLTTVAGYTVAARALAPAIDVAGLVPAVAVVMLSASLPISLGGWGMREISAVLVLGVVGLTGSDAFTIAVLIGMISIMLVGILAFVTADFWGTFDKTTHPISVNYNELIAWALPIMAATGVLFQVYVPFRSSMLNVNLADPIALLGGAFFMHSAWRYRALPAWRYGHINLVVAAATLAVVAALLIGAARFGFTPWATTNKFAGWFILLCYLATGALIMRTAGEEGLRILLTTFVAAIAAIVLMETVTEIIQNAGISIVGIEPTYARAGFAQNRNAFAFQLLMAAAAAIAVMRGPTRTVFLSVIVLGLWLAGSRAGWGAILVMAGFALHLRMVGWRELVVAAVVATAILGLTLLPLIANALPEFASGAQASSPPAVAWQRFALPEQHSTAERFYSLAGGWRLFLDHPVFGAGLGAFMQAELDAAGRPLVIHSTPLWLLAEFGIVGFAVFFIPACLIFVRELAGKVPDRASGLLVLMFAGFAVMALAHEMLYQRSFWLLFGAALALAPRSARLREQHAPAV